ncbi:cingulin-like isoform X2 [Dendronephthya gigantea]|uniref:cingulin-like isoform X2 n=1 Tax=Dendronephthya gigantea TaxID=151771 RepID=UPI00106C86B8|nr:cingulin-like isoform X2 [Dendronephthya gigantea]
MVGIKRDGPTVLMRITKILVYKNERDNAEKMMMNQLEKMGKKLDFEQESDKLILEEIKKLNVEIKTSNGTWCFCLSRTNKVSTRMNELRKMEKMLHYDKMVMEKKIRNLIMEVMKNLVKKLDCEPFVSLCNQGVRKGLSIMDDFEKIEKMLDLEQESDKLMMAKIKSLKVEVMKIVVRKLAKDLDCERFVSSKRNEIWIVMNELEKMEKMLDLQQKSDKLIMVKIKKLKMVVMKKLVRNLERELDCEGFSWEVHKGLSVMDDLEKIEKMLDLDQELDKMMMEEIKKLKTKILDNLIKELAEELVCWGSSSGTILATDAMDNLKKMENMLDLEHKPDKLMHEEIKKLKMKVMKIAVRELLRDLDDERYTSWGENKTEQVLNELKIMENMLDLEQESDKLMMEEIKKLKMEVMKNLVKTLATELDREDIEGENKTEQVMNELKMMERMLDLEQESDKLMMEEIKKLKMEVIKNLVKTLATELDREDIEGRHQTCEVMNELKMMGNTLDLEQESDKLMMVKIRKLEMEVIKNLVKNLARELDCRGFISWTPNEGMRYELMRMEMMLNWNLESDELLKELICKVNLNMKMPSASQFVTDLIYPCNPCFWPWHRVVRIRLKFLFHLKFLANKILMKKKKSRCEKRKALLAKKSVYSKKGCSYSEKFSSKKRTYSKLNCGCSDMFLSKDDNANSERDCSLLIQVTDATRLQLALACKTRSEVVFKAKRRIWRKEPPQIWRELPPRMITIYLISKMIFWLTYGILMQDYLAKATFRFTTF